jgi:phage terminase large subunit-like protein
VYGEASAWMDLDRLVAEARDSREDEFRRFFLNQPVARSTAWLSPAAWATCSDPDYRAPDGTRVVLAFDGSYRLDSSALLAATVEARPYLWLLGLWERPERTPADWTVDRGAVDATVWAAMDSFDVAELCFDPPGWHAEADRWADSFGDVVVAFSTATRSRMAAACTRFYSAVMGGQVAHDGDARLARHIGNAVLRDTAQGGYISKDAPNSPRKIDAAVAAVVAHERAVWHFHNQAPAWTGPMVAFGD